MEVIVKSSPKIEIEFATKVVNVGGKVTVDSALSTESENPVMNKVITEELNKKATSEALGALSESVVSLEVKNEAQDERMRILEGEVVRKGDYSPENKVGTADDLAGRGESVPAEFGFRASGGKSIKDGRAYIKRIKGNSVVWNQLVKDNLTERTINGVTFTPQGDGGILVNGTASVNTYFAITNNKVYIANHKVCLIGSKNDVGIMFGGNILDYQINKNYIFSKAESFDNQCFLYIKSGSVIENVTIYPIVTDLTQMFQAGNEPTTIEDFNARVATLGIDLNAYNEGQVIHCNTESIKSVGDNAWDEEWELGKIDKTNGELVSGTTMIRSKNAIRVIPGSTYYYNIPNAANSSYMGFATFYDNTNTFVSYKPIAGTAYMNVVTPSNAEYMRFYLRTEYGTTYNHDIMISLVHSGWKQDTDAGYQPYWQDTLPLPIINKYFPDGMKSTGTAHDEIRYNKATKKWEYSKGKIKSVDLGTLEWKNLDASKGMFWLSQQEVIDLNMATHDNENIPTNLISSLYASAPTYDIVNIDKVFRGPFTTKFSGYLTVKDTAYNDAAAFKAAMQGVILYYEAADWEWVELDEADQNFRDYYQVADFGTEMSQSSVPSAPFSADIIYQFNAVDMIREHELEITELQNIIATMQAQLTALTNGGQ